MLIEDYKNNEENNKNKENKEEKNKEKVEEKYEDKYWDKYRQCPNEYAFTMEDLTIESDKYKELNQNEEKDNVKEEDLKQEAYEFMENQFLLRFKNSYIMENTPLGNVCMSYNHETQSFEFYSDKTIPYRYLEPVARKYVSTFLCKGLYVNMEEELKEAQKRKVEEEQKINEKMEKIKEENKKTKDIFARLKSYNTPNPANQSTNTKPNAKTNSSKRSVPSHVKSQLISKILPDKNNMQLLKETANRYTHKGKFTNFIVLQLVDKKVNNKNYVLTYSEFRKTQMCK